MPYNTYYSTNTCCKCNMHTKRYSPSWATWANREAMSSVSVAISKTPPYAVSPQILGQQWYRQICWNWEISIISKIMVTTLRTLWNLFTFSLTLISMCVTHFKCYWYTTNFTAKCSKWLNKQKILLTGQYKDCKSLLNSVSLFTTVAHNTAKKLHKSEKNYK